MMAGIRDMQAGDYVKLAGGRLEKISSVYGVDAGGGLAKPSEGGFGVVTESGRRVSMWDVMRYLKADEVPADKR
jgi:hypothetical protein